MGRRSWSINGDSASPFTGRLLRGGSSGGGSGGGGARGGGSTASGSGSTGTRGGTTPAVIPGAYTGTRRNGGGGCNATCKMTLIIVGSLIGALILLAILAFCYSRHRSKRAARQNLTKAKNRGHFAPAGGFDFAAASKADAAAPLPYRAPGPFNPLGVSSPSPVQPKADAAASLPYQPYHGPATGAVPNPINGNGRETVFVPKPLV